MRIGIIEGYVTHSDYASAHNVTENVVRKWIHSGKLDAVKIGNSYFVKEDEPLPPNIARLKMSEKIKYYTRNKQNGEIFFKEVC